MLQSMRDGASSIFMKIIFMGLLVMATLGLVLMDMGGFFRSGPSLAVAFEVEGQEFSTVELDRMVTEQLRQQGLTLEQGLEQGIVDQIINAQVEARLLGYETRRLGVRVPDSIVAEHARSLVSSLTSVFQQQGQDIDQGALFRQFVNNMGMTEAQYVQYQKNEIASNLVNESLISSKYTPDILVDALMAYDTEQRVAETYDITVTDSDITAPSEEELKAYYETVKAAYEIPEYRSFNMAVMKLEDVQNDLALGDDIIKAEYEYRRDNGDYAIPEQRRITQASIETQEDAQKVYEMAKDDGDLRAALKSVVGNTQGYIVADDYDQSGLPEELSDVAFSAQKGDVTEPVQTALGWYVMRIDEVMSARNKPLDDEIKNEIITDLKYEKGADALFDLSNNFEDMLAGGSTLKEAGDALNVAIVEWSAIDGAGRPKAKDGKTLDEDAVVGSEKVVEAVFETGEGMASYLVENEQGDFIIVEVTSVEPSLIPSYEDIKDSVKKDWVAKQKDDLALQKAEDLIAQLAENPNAVSFKTQKPVRRITEDTDASQDEIETVALFQLNSVGEVTSIPTSKGRRLIRLKDIILEDAGGEAAKAMAEKRGAYTRGFTQSILDDYYTQLKDRVDVEIHHDAIEEFYRQRLEQNI